MTLSERIKKRREALGMSQQLLAEKAGVRQSAISYAESGSDIRTSTLKAIAVALNISISDLLNDNISST